MGQKVVLSDITFTDLTLPKLYPDPVMSDGAILLIDASNPAGYDNGSTVPVNGTLLPNIAWEQAKAQIGSGDRTTLSPTWSQSFTGTSSAKHKIEFTGKKGLHGIISQSPGVSAGASMGLVYPTTIRDLIYANRAHSFYLSIWGKLTRQWIAPFTAPQTISHNAGNTSNFQYFMDHNGINKNGGSVRQNPSPANTLGNFIRNASWAGFVGADPGAGSWSGRKIINWGSSDAWAGFNLINNPSFIFYKFYLEDLTVSGRTYAQVDAIDLALWTAAFASGGRFYNDTTYTDPATIP